METFFTIKLICYRKKEVESIQLNFVGSIHMHIHIILLHTYRQTRRNYRLYRIENDVQYTHQIERKVCDAIDFQN